MFLLFLPLLLEQKSVSRELNGNIGAKYGRSKEEEEDTNKFSIDSKYGGFFWLVGVNYYLYVEK
jgi:hypothetical protein